MTINNRNNKTTRFNAARDNNINCIICKKPGHVVENCYHLTKAQKAISRKQNPNFFMQNQQPSNNHQQRENIYNNSASNNYRNNHFLGNRNNNYDNNNFSRNRNNDNRQENLDRNSYANHNFKIKIANVKCEISN